MSFVAEHDQSSQTFFRPRPRQLDGVINLILSVRQPLLTHLHEQEATHLHDQRVEEKITSIDAPIRQRSASVTTRHLSTRRQIDDASRSRLPDRNGAWQATGTDADCRPQLIFNGCINYRTRSVIARQT